MRIAKNLGRNTVVRVLCLTLAGCPAAPNLNAGALGEPVDLKGLLPPDVLEARTSENDAATAHQDTVLVGPQCAPVEVNWLAFQSGQGQYLLSARARLLKPVEYDSLTFALMPGTMTNVGTATARIEALTFALNWSTHTFFSTTHGTATIHVRADGQSTINTICPLN